MDKGLLALKFNEGAPHPQPDDAQLRQHQILHGMQTIQRHHPQQPSPARV